MPYSQKSKSRWLVWSLILIDVILILVLLIWRELLRTELGEEVYKLLWEVAAITIGGGFISLIIEKIKREQELRDAKREYLRDFYLRALAEYNKAKKCRRMLRAKAIYKEQGIWHLRANESIDILAEIEDSQLGLETMVKEIEKPSYAFMNKNKITDLFTKMEKY